MCIKYVLNIATEKCQLNPIHTIKDILPTVISYKTLSSSYNVVFKMLIGSQGCALHCIHVSLMIGHAWNSKWQINTCIQNS